MNIPGFTAEASLASTEHDYFRPHNARERSGTVVAQLLKVVGSHGPIVAGYGCICVDGFADQGAYCICQGRLL